MNYLLVGDLHLTDRPRDAYRFGIFKWIREQQIKHKVDATFIMGDICDKKDFHSATLVNRLIEELLTLKKPVYILKGNHDYTDPDNPFFSFLSWLDGITFVTNPDVVCRDTSPVALLPHCQSEGLFKENCKAFAESRPKIDLLLMHQTFEGAIAETGAVLSGFRQSPIELLKLKLGAYAGDVHKPQRAAKVTYVGAPYHIRFGDDFAPRCILLPGLENRINLYFETVRKWSLLVRDPIDISSNKDLMPGDQVKVTIELAREEAVEWQSHKRKVIEALKKKELEIYGVDLKINTNTSSAHRQRLISPSAQTHQAVFNSFCKNETVNTGTKLAGELLLKG